MGTPEKIYELVKTMPENQVAEVLDFVEFLLYKAKPQMEQDTTQKEETQPRRPLSDYAGLLKDSPTFKEDPVELQRRMRDEWS